MRAPVVQAAEAIIVRPVHRNEAREDGNTRGHRADHDTCVRPPSEGPNPRGDEARTEHVLERDFGRAGCVSSDGSSLGRREVA